MDFGKYKYEAAVKAREARKNQTNTVLKEIRFRLKIDTHDYETKRGHALRFLGAGDKVKAMIQFRGREQQRPEMGIRLLQRFADDVAEVGVVESSPRIDGRNMVMVVGPLKNKAEAKAEARRATQRAEAKAQNEAKATGGGRIDVSGDDQAPLTQSLADLLPEGFAITTEPEIETPAQSEAPEAPVEAAPEAEAPAKEAPKQEAAKQEAPAEEAPKQEAPKQETPKQEAPKVAKQAAPKREAPKAEAPRPAVSKPVVAKAPETPKPAAAAPVAPKPAGVPAPPPKPVARPAAPKPAARPAAPKPGSKKTN
jgi:translation initiation factor IF-3